MANSLLDWDYSNGLPLKAPVPASSWEVPQAYLGRDVDSSLDHCHARRFKWAAHQVKFHCSSFGSEILKKDAADFPLAPFFAISRVNDVSGVL